MKLNMTFDDFQTRVWDAMPSLIYASVGVVCTFTCMLLPETRGRRLPDNIAEAEQIGT